MFNTMNKINFIFKFFIKKIKNQQSDLQCRIKILLNEIVQIRSEENKTGMSFGGLKFLLIITKYVCVSGLVYKF